MSVSAERLLVDKILELYYLVSRIGNLVSGEVSLVRVFAHCSTAKLTSQPEEKEGFISTIEKYFLSFLLKIKPKRRTRPEV